MWIFSLEQNQKILCSILQSSDSIDYYFPQFMNFHPHPLIFIPIILYNHIARLINYPSFQESERSFPLPFVILRSDQDRDVVGFFGF